MEKQYFKSFPNHPYTFFNSKKNSKSVSIIK